MVLTIMDDKETQVRNYLLLSYIPELSKADTKALTDQGLSVEEIWQRFKRKVANISKAQGEVEKELSRVKDLGFRIITASDEEYPKRLWQVHDPPLFLYVKGEILPEDELSLAIVGTRSYTGYGRDVVERIVPQLVASGLAIVSGMARGIDSFAHQAALEGGGRTIAVLGSGLNVVYPPENDQLYKDIAENGAVISEFPLDFEPTNFSFPARNRVISGMTLGTWVVEAGEKSGALITADLAMQQGREVFALPGSIYSSVSVGCNELIKQGAIPVTQASDILDVLEVKEKAKKVKARQVLPENKEEKVLLELLASTPKHVDELVRESGLPTSTVGATLSMMEIKGLVKNIGGGEYKRE